MRGDQTQKVGGHTLDIGHVVLILQQHPVSPGNLLALVGSLVEELLADDHAPDLLLSCIILHQPEEGNVVLEVPALVPGGGARQIVGLQPQDVLLHPALSVDELRLGRVAYTHTHTHTPQTIIRYSKPNLGAPPPNQK
jgi:hypothetical protein